MSLYIRTWMHKCMDRDSKRKRKVVCDSRKEMGNRMMRLTDIGEGEDEEVHMATYIRTGTKKWKRMIV